MAVKVTLTNKSQIVTPTSSGSGNKLHMARSIYQQLGSLVKNKAIVESYNNGILPAEYKELLDKFNEIDQLRRSGSVLPDDLLPYALTDEYLGDLGVIQEYPYLKDVIELKNWLSGEGLDVYRILVEEEDDLTNILMDGEEMLVSYTNR